MQLREFSSKKKFVSNDSELSNSARNGKKNWRQIAVPTPFFQLVNIYIKRRLFSFLTYVLRIKPSLKITDYAKVAKLPLPPYIPLIGRENINLAAY